MAKSAMSWSWVFQGEKSTFPSAVFSDQETAEVWIAKSKVSGILTGYPLDECVYDWAIEAGHFSIRTRKRRGLLSLFRSSRWRFCLMRTTKMVSGPLGLPRFRVLRWERWRTSDPRDVLLRNPVSLPRLSFGDDVRSPKSLLPSGFLSPPGSEQFPGELLLLLRFATTWACRWIAGDEPRSTRIDIACIATAEPLFHSWVPWPKRGGCCTVKSWRSSQTWKPQGLRYVGI